MPVDQKYKEPYCFLMYLKTFADISRQVRLTPEEQRLVDEGFEAFFGKPKKGKSSCVWDRITEKTRSRLIRDGVRRVVEANLRGGGRLAVCLAFSENSDST